MPNIADANILILATNGFEDSELLKPLEVLKQAGARTTLASLSRDDIEGDKGAKITPDTVVAEVDLGEFDALLLPGGAKNPDTLRMDEQVVAMVRSFANSGRPWQRSATLHGFWPKLTSSGIAR